MFSLLMLPECPASHVMWKRVFLRAVGVGGVLIQYGCIAHCTLEFVGDFVVVSINEISKIVTADNAVTIGHLLKHVQSHIFKMFYRIKKFQSHILEMSQIFYVK